MMEKAKARQTVMKTRRAEINMKGRQPSLIASGTISESKKKKDDVKKVIRSESKSTAEPFLSRVSQYLFPGLPEHYPLRKKIAIAKSNSLSGEVWDFLQTIFVLTVCGLYVAGTYYIDHATVNLFYTLENVITQFFVVDFILHLYIRSEWSHFADPITIIDILTIVPAYVSYGVGQNYVKVNFLRCLRILRLLRIFRTFKPIRNLSGVRRQVILLVLTLVSLVFLAAGLVQLMENDVLMLTLNCKYINALTKWQPSCSSYLPASDPLVAESCDCSMYSCARRYLPGDRLDQPSGMRCVKLSFYDAFYFVIVTVASVGYGDISLTSIPSRSVVIILIITTLILIPMRLSELQKLLSLSSPYQQPYIGQNNESHVIVCGHTSDRKKLERFLKEFFHPDRSTNAGQDYHAVFLAQEEPLEEIRSLIFSHAFESKCTYVIGSALSVTDLRRVKAETASAIFFLCDSDAHEATAHILDAANIMRALSVSNFNADLDCLVQVLRPEDRSILKDSDVDVILCLDEFKTALQARNAICPGFSTVIENIFHSFGSVDAEIEKAMAPWYKEYLHGAGMELYFVPLNASFLKSMRYSFRRIAEAILHRFNTIVLGVCDRSHSELVFNPNKKDIFYMDEFEDIKQFYFKFNVLLIIADDQHHAEEMSKDLNDRAIVSEMLEQFKVDESAFPCTKSKDKPLAFSASQLTRLAPTHSYSREADKEEDEFTDSDDEYMLSDDEDETTYIGFNRRVPAQSPERIRLHTPPSSMSGGTSLNGNARYVDMTLPTNLNNIASVYPNKPTAGQSFGNYHKPSVSSKLVMDNVDFIISDLVPGQYGYQSRVIDNCKNIANHVVVFGCDANLPMFIAELRRPAVRGETYHAIVIVAEEFPSQWSSLCSKYNDLYFVQGKIIQMEIFNRLNIEEAYAIILLSSRDEVTKVDESNISSTTLFAYLKLEAHIPRNVFFTVELNSADNMSVLNATIMRRARIAAAEAMASLVANIESGFGAVGARDDSNRRDSNIQKRKTTNSGSPSHGGTPDSENSSNDSSSKTGTIQKSLSSNTFTPSILTGPLQHRLTLPPQISNKPSDIVAANMTTQASTSSPTAPAAPGGRAAVRRQSVIFDGNGRFATKRDKAPSSNTTGHDKTKNRLGNMNGPSEAVEGETPTRRKSNIVIAPKGTIEKLSIAMNKTAVLKSLKEDEELWDAMDSHHVLPVFASARAFVPSSFESLLVQSFYVKLTPIICDKFVCGQLGQTVMLVDVPLQLLGRPFFTLFRIFINYQVLCFGLYRAPQKTLGSTLPYVYVSPPKETLLSKFDRVYIYSNNVNMLQAVEFCENLKI